MFRRVPPSLADGEASRDRLSAVACRVAGTVAEGIEDLVDPKHRFGRCLELCFMTRQALDPYFLTVVEPI